MFHLEFLASALYILFVCKPFAQFWVIMHCIELISSFFLFFFKVHMRDPNNQLHVIKNLKIAVSNIVTQPPQPGAIRKLLNDVVSGSQPAEGLVANVITAGDYDLNISGM